MKKYMVADMLKDARSDLINRAKEAYDLNDSEAERLVDNFPNESTWADVEEVAESLGLDITDVEDDDVESYMEMGGIVKGELESSVGPIQWLYDNKAKAYMVYLMLGDTPVIYRELKIEQMQEWTDSESMGKYYNDNIRGQIDDSQGCGCNDDPCTQEDIDTFTTKFDSIS
jgi:predicted transcriptional regulator